MSKLYFRYAAMNAGKSTMLLQIKHNYESMGRSVLLMTAAVDDRFGTGKITSRLGVSSDAESYTPTTDMFERVGLYAAPPCEYCDGTGDVTTPTGEWRGTCICPAGKPEQLGAVLVDEAQFLSPEQVKGLHRAVHTFDVPVLCFGLRSDFQGNAFPGSAMLLTLAEDIEEIKSICSCGAKASMNMRVDASGKRVLDGPQVLIGDATYRPVCGRCFYK